MLFSLPNLASQSVSKIKDPSLLTPAPVVEKGAERTKWATDPATNHHFLSGFEGAIPNQRIVKDINPAAKIYAIIADYDNAGITDELLASLASKPDPLLVPTWTTRTMTPGRARLVWELEEPVWLPESPKAQKAFMKLVSKQLGLEHALPGFDPASLAPNQYFELGHSWTRMGGKIPYEVAGLWLVTSTKNEAQPRVGAPEIPLEEVHAAIEAKWPGRWTGNFSEGARGPLFWVDPFEDRAGAVVRATGMQSYSTRSEKGFLFWSELLGNDFVRKWEAAKMETVANDLWYDGKSYWWKENDTWIGRNKEDTVMHLQYRGFSSKVEGKATISEAGKLLVFVQQTRLIDYAAPVMFDANDLCDVNGDRVLNISKRSVMEPAEKGDPSQFPWIHDFLWNIWDGYSLDGVSQRDYFLAWLKRLWKSGYNRNLAPGHMLVIAGGAGQGKTFLNRCILGEAMGGSVDASEILQGNTSFNKQASEVAIWRIDDGTSQATRSAQVKFAETLKKHVANPTSLYHPKFRDALELPWKGRIVLTCNTDPDSLAIIPPLDNTMSDKVMLLKFSDSWRPSFLRKSEDNEALVRNELPYFLAWLRDWETPDACRDLRNPRYGIKAIHHPDLITAARESSSAYGVQEALDIWRKAQKELAPGETEWSGTVTELLSSVQMTGNGLLRGTSPVTFGRDIRKLMGVWEPLLRRTTCQGTGVYYVSLD